jgi:hypothetical protein
MSALSYWTFCISVGATLALAQPTVVGGATPWKTKNTSSLGIDQKNRFVAVGLSAVLPGAGEKYLGLDQRARWFLAADLALWAGWLGSRQMQKNALASAHAYAVKHTQNPSLAKDEALLEAMVKWRARSSDPTSQSNPELGDQYDLDMMRSGEDQANLLPSTQAYAWSWGSAESEQTQKVQARFSDQMDEWRTTRISTQIMLGGLVLNRLVSVVDVWVTMRRASGLQMGFMPNENGDLEWVVAGQF